MRAQALPETIETDRVGGEAVEDHGRFSEQKYLLPESIRHAGGVGSAVALDGL